MVTKIDWWEISTLFMQFSCFVTLANEDNLIDRFMPRLYLTGLTTRNETGCLWKRISKL